MVFRTLCFRVSMRLDLHGNKKRDTPDCVSLRRGRAGRFSPTPASLLDRIFKILNLQNLLKVLQVLKVLKVLCVLQP